MSKAVVHQFNKNTGGHLCGMRAETDAHGQCLCNYNKPRRKVTCRKCIALKKPKVDRAPGYKAAMKALREAKHILSRE